MQNVLFCIIYHVVKYRDLMAQEYKKFISNH